MLRGSSKEQITALFEESDLDKNGHIDFEEFLEVTAHKSIELGDDHGPEAQRKVFAQFDTDKDGFINREELLRALRVINPTHSEEEIEVMLKNSDLNLDGKISFEEFCSLKQ
ncbi:hypothetical protein L0F63_001259 [Massospora cicadina]|nr:hypothetical protein L0F63_001259 [Massospora cicadina]